MQKEEQLLEKRLIELSRLAYNRDIITYTDFLNLNELNILHSLPKNLLYSGYITFGGYDLAERQMAAFLPDALSLRCPAYAKLPAALSGLGSAARDDTENSALSDVFSQEMCVLKIAPLNKKYAEELTHRDYLGAILNLGIDRSKTGDILVRDTDAVLFVKPQLRSFLMEELTRIRHTSVFVSEEPLQEFDYSPRYEEIKGTVASVRLDSLLSLAFSSSRSKLTGLIEGGKVFVNGRLMTTNSYQVREGDIISVRGMGKFRFCERLSITKKNRIYVLIYK